MTGSSPGALLPLLILGGTAVATSGLIAIRRTHKGIALLAAAGLIATVAAILVPSASSIAAADPLVVIDSFAAFFMVLLTAATLVVLAMAYGYFRGRANSEEFYALLLFANLGTALLVTSIHFASFFIGLEILSISLYALIAYPRLDRALEAGLKYLVLAAVSSAFLLFGLALLYAATGSLGLPWVALHLAAPQGHSAWMNAGVFLAFTAIGFKLGVVPFHLWTPDIFEGAPAPSAGFIATVSKGSIFALLLRYFSALKISHERPVVAALGAIAILSMLLGTVLAFRQQNLKRLLAYSSIAHMGYLLVPLLAAGAFAVEAVSFYLLAYFVTTLGAFAVISLASGVERDQDEIGDYQGLFWSHPLLALALSLMLLSLAGIPLTAGFIGKYYVLAAGVDSGRWALVLVMIGSSIMGLYVYLRVVVALFAPANHSEGRLLGGVSGSGVVALASLLIVLLWLGIAPSPAIALLKPLIMR